MSKARLPRYSLMALTKRQEFTTFYVTSLYERFFVCDNFYFSHKR